MQAMSSCVGLLPAPDDYLGSNPSMVHSLSNVVDPWLIQSDLYSSVRIIRCQRPTRNFHTYPCGIRESRGEDPVTRASKQIISKLGLALTSIKTNENEGGRSEEATDKSLEGASLLLKKNLEGEVGGGHGQSKKEE
ncbi:hypothetical protein PIB30_039839 [Stylosanthes scabra]|uniref:Uncharacterized protein n=2 Tax=Stylosanthes scabra TaxID=79078 RepID=A0ABU6TE23_9FABA|nr:hypothetical protein [Stylosanthes scabra]